ncbi:MAG: tetratricopeptide repeat protein [bacterium]
MRTAKIFGLCFFLAVAATGCDPYSEGMNLLEQGKYEAAAEFFYQAVKENPEDARAHHQLGYSYSRLKMYKEAIKQYQKALELKPEYFEARLNLGTVYLKNRQAKKALEELKKAVELKPKNETARVNLAWAYYYNLELDKAAEHRQKAVELSGGEKEYADLKQWLDSQKKYVKKDKDEKAGAEEAEKERESVEAASGATAEKSP